MVEMKIKDLVVEKLISLNKQEILENINPKNILTLITFSMAIVEKNFKNLKGVDKKQMCLNAIFDLLEESSINNEKKDYISSLITDIYDSYVENIIKVSKGEFDINKVVPIAKKLFKILKKFVCKTDK